MPPSPPPEVTQNIASALAILIGLVLSFIFVIHWVIIFPSLTIVILILYLLVLLLSVAVVSYFIFEFMCESHAAQLKRQKRREQPVHDVLEDLYEPNQYPARKDVQELAELTDLTEQEVRKWFCDRRREDRQNEQSPPVATSGSDTPQTETRRRSPRKSTTLVRRM